MTFFTLAGKCGAFAPAPKIFSPLSSEASAIRPSPTPQRLKKWRRVSSRSGSFSFIASLPRHEIVKVEEHARQRRPGRELRNLLGIHRFLRHHRAARRGVENLLLHHH